MYYRHQITITAIEFLFAYTVANWQMFRYWSRFYRVWFSYKFCHICSISENFEDDGCFIWTVMLWKEKGVFVHFLWWELISKNGMRIDFEKSFFYIWNSDLRISFSLYKTEAVPICYAPWWVFNWNIFKHNGKYPTKNGR